ncbi:MAG: chemotaxis protein CheW [Christensenellales bacterium]|jgi:two-component system chemotaxis sensor kinase CheA
MSTGDSMLDAYLYEVTQLLDSLESLLLSCESSAFFAPEQIAELFRILHTIKGSSAMMDFEGITSLSHALEDLFDFMRENEPHKSDFESISELAFETLDTIKAEVAKIQSGALPDADVSPITKRIRDYLAMLTSRKESGEMLPDSPGEAEDGKDRYYEAKVTFVPGAKMENVRAFGIANSLEGLCSSVTTVPKDLFAEHSSYLIASDGCTFYMVSKKDMQTLEKKIREAFFIQSLDIWELDKAEAARVFGLSEEEALESSASSSIEAAATLKQSFMSVSIHKLDMLMDLVGELVITESTVINNPEVTKLKLESFEKAARQLRKLTDELQDVVMSIRMIPVSSTFHKMERVVRDMSVKTGKKARLVISGEDTELDKNVLDHLSDPLMHIIRNSMDHGLETAEEREALGKNPVGEIRLDARNSGSDVLITVSDDGRGLNREKLIDKGIAKGLIKKPRHEISDSEAYNLIFTPGFSTKEQVTEYSGRGVGMDVVLKNIRDIGGSVFVDSTPGAGMSSTIRIPLTLAIIDGMLVSVGKYTYILPLLSIKDSFKPNKKDLIKDPSGNEMIWLRGACYPIVRLHELFGIETDVTDICDGILVLIEAQTRSYCLFVDNLIGEQQTVVKSMPAYITKHFADASKTMSGCTILGDGSVSVILNINGLVG